MSSGFISLSADPEYVRKKSEHRMNEALLNPADNPIRIYDINSIIFYIGPLTESFLDYGRKLGFVLKKYDTQDPSILISAKFLILSDLDMDLKKRIETINVAACYGLKIFWYSKKSIPHRFMWRFQLCSVGDTIENFWRDVWELVM